MSKLKFKINIYNCYLQGEVTISIEDRIQRQVIVADSILYQGILVFTNQDIPSYIKGGWYLRKAYKIYEKLHKEVNQLIGNLKLKKVNHKIVCQVQGQGS